jgi:hypothetical protein
MEEDLRRKYDTKKKERRKEEIFIEILDKRGKRVIT